MSMIKPVVVLAASVVLLCFGAAFADVMNGDFEDGGNLWQVDAPTNWFVEFPAAGGNPGGCATIRSPFGGQGGTACLEQSFVCGDPNSQGVCTIIFDYMLEAIDASPNSAHIVLTIDGFSYPVATGDVGWSTFPIELTCGVHVLQLCMVVDPINNGWIATFDNVRSICDSVANEATNWSTIKALYH